MKKLTLLFFLFSFQLLAVDKNITAITLSDSEFETLCRENICTEIKKEKEKSQEGQKSKAISLKLRPQKDCQDRVSVTLNPIIGSNYLNFIGMAYDIPRQLLYGASVGLIFCHGKCQTYFELSGGVGRRKKESLQKIIHSRALIGIHYNPLNYKKFSLGFGPDISLRFDKISIKHNKVVVSNRLFSMDYGLSLKLKFKIFESRKKQKVKGSLTFSTRFFLQTGLLNCQSIKRSKNSSEGCVGTQGLKTLEGVFIQGAGLETNLGIELRFK